jgi:hypothetical protein
MEDGEPPLPASELEVVNPLPPAPTVTAYVVFADMLVDPVRYPPAPPPPDAPPSFALAFPPVPPPATIRYSTVLGPV